MATPFSLASTVPENAETDTARLAIRLIAFADFFIPIFTPYTNLWKYINYICSHFVCN
jgi:hypothetical protein